MPKSMNLSLFIHSDSRGPRATVTAWWVDETGMNHAELMTCHALTHSGDEMNPWSLISALYVELAAVKNVRTAPQSEDQGAAAVELPDRR